MKSFGEYKPALYSYIDIPSIFIFGLTPFAVRLPSAIFGVLSVILIYIIAFKMFKNKSLALISASLMAISPWHIILSRTTSEVVISTFFICLMIGLLIFNNKRSTQLFALIFGILAIFSYTASSFFVIIMWGLFLFFSRKQKILHANKVSIYLFIILIIISFSFSFLGPVSRFKQISIFSYLGASLVLEEQIREDEFIPTFITRVFHNKVINYSRLILKNYSDYFTLDYLGLNGGYPQRVRVPNVGLFYMWEIPFLLIGILGILRRKDIYSKFLIAWWLILLIPSALTFDEIPNIYRSLVVLPPMIIIVAIGLYDVFHFISKNKFFQKIVMVAILIIGVWELLYFQHQYFKHQEVHRPWYRSYAYKGLVNNLIKFYANYKQIVITRSVSSPYIHILFYTKYDPKKYQMQGSKLDTEFTGFDKYYFVPFECPLNENDTDKKVRGELGVLYVSRGNCNIPTHNVKLLETIYWQDNNPAFTLLEYVSTESASINK